MSATTAAPLGQIDISGTPQIPFARLVKVEARKLVDTASGFWLLAATAIITGIVLTIQLLVGLSVDDLTLDDRAFVTGMSTPMGVLLPVLGILSITSEWGQRTALTSFALVPSRARLIGAKFVTALLVAVGALIVGGLLGAGANVLFGALSGDGAEWTMGVTDYGYFGLLQLIGMSTGFAFGALFLSTPVAIVLYFVYSFVLPGLFGLGAAFLGWFADLQPWIDFGFAQMPLQTGDMNGEAWAHLAVSGLIWFVAPLVIGTLRVLRSEVK